ncbi:MAG: mce8E [Nocardia sp.]|uniref:MlaD family protein n=1 Tax=Nocardia sp. TaxID=1821 RepID=UPI00262C0068|nr:MlaD family protein [Nocardia sp.]MCU1639969.1 mce8E [Nocardia sp.]
MTARIGKAVATLAITAVIGTGCGFDPGQIPVPGTSVSGPTYRIRIEFASALNLPTQAKVVVDGARIGTLRGVRVSDPGPSHPGHVVADVDISSSVHLSGSTVAQLRQDTILGDTYIGLSTPAGPPGPVLAPNGTIPLSQTRPALQIEDLMAGLSTFVTGGAIQQFQDIVDNINSVMPDNPEQTAHIFAVVGGDIEDVAHHLDTVDSFLASLQQTLDATLGNRDALQAILSERGAADIPADMNSLIATLGILGGMGVDARSILWLGNILKAGDATAKAVVPLLLANDPLNLDAPSNLNRIVALLRDKIIPFAERGPKVNLTRVSTEPAPGQSVPQNVQIDSILATLRMIGAAR